LAKGRALYTPTPGASTLKTGLDAAGPQDADSAKLPLRDLENGALPWV